MTARQLALGDLAAPPTTLPPGASVNVNPNGRWALEVRAHAGTPPRPPHTWTVMPGEVPTTWGWVGLDSRADALTLAHAVEEGRP